MRAENQGCGKTLNRAGRHTSENSDIPISEYQTQGINGHITMSMARRAARLGSDGVDRACARRRDSAIKQLLRSHGKMDRECGDAVSFALAIQDFKSTW